MNYDSSIKKNQKQTYTTVGSYKGNIVSVKRIKKKMAELNKETLTEFRQVGLLLFFFYRVILVLWEL